MRRVDAVIWDLDGTLIDTDLYVVVNYLHMFEMFRPGHYPHLVEMLRFSGPSEFDTLKEQFPDYPVEVTMKEFQRFCLERGPQLQTLYEGEIETLKALREMGIKMCVLTNKRRESALQALEMAGLSEFMEFTCAVDDMPVPKPAPDGVYMCLDRLGTPKERTILIGDTAFDLKAANSAGILSGLVTWSPRGIPDIQRDIDFEGMEDIRRWIADEPVS